MRTMLPDLQILNSPGHEISDAAEHFSIASFDVNIDAYQVHAGSLSTVELFVRGDPGMYCTMCMYGDTECASRPDIASTLVRSAPSIALLQARRMHPAACTPGLQGIARRGSLGGAIGTNWSAALVFGQQCT